MIPYAADVLLIGCAGMLFLSSRSVWARIVALLWSTFPVFIIPLTLPVVWLMHYLREVPDFAHSRVPLALLGGVILKASLLLLLFLKVSNLIHSNGRQRFSVEQGAARESPFAATALGSSEAMDAKPKSEAPAEGGGR